MDPHGAAGGEIPEGGESMTTLQQLTELGYDLASKFLITTKEQLLSCFTLAKEDGSIDIIHTPWEDDDQKKEMVLTIGRNIISMKEPVSGYCLLSEVWLSHYKLNEAMRADRPENDPKRREGVICLASDGQEHLFRSWEIGRDNAGRCVSLTYTEKDGAYESWMIEALDRALALQRLKHKLVQEYKSAGGKVTPEMLETLEGLPEGIKEAVKRHCG
jgi:hypothetical protein